MDELSELDELAELDELSELSELDELDELGELGELADQASEGYCVGNLLEASQLPQFPAPMAPNTVVTVMEKDLSQTIVFRPKVLNKQNKIKIL